MRCPCTRCKATDEVVLDSSGAILAAANEELQTQTIKIAPRYLNILYSFARSRSQLPAASSLEGADPEKFCPRA